MKIERKGLVLTTKEILSSEGSQNVPIELENDATYSDYDKEILVSYLHGSKATMLTKQNNKYIMPLDIFAQSGIITIAVRMSKGSEIIVTKPLALRIEKAPNTSTIVPLDEDWETVVEKYVANVTNALNKVVVCSQADYDAIETKLDNTFYYIWED